MAKLNFELESARLTVEAKDIDRLHEEQAEPRSMLPPVAFIAVERNIAGFFRGSKSSHQTG